MINHIRTLLLNRNSSTVKAWYTDPTFIPLQIPTELLNFHNLLFSGTDYLSDRIDRISNLMPFVLDPEFADARKLIDWRVTIESDDPEHAIKYSTVFDFYKNIKPAYTEVINNCITNVNTPLIFAWGDEYNEDVTSCIRRLKSVFYSSKETTKRFSACLWAYLLRLETVRLKSIGRVSK